MKKLSFDKLDMKTKGNFVLVEEGKFIASREYYNQRLVLYDMGEFFAEVWYGPQGNKIHKIESMSLGDKKVNLYIHSNTVK